MCIVALHIGIFLHPSQHVGEALQALLLQGEEEGALLNPLFKTVMAMDWSRLRSSKVTALKQLRYEWREDSLSPYRMVIK